MYCFTFHKYSFSPPTLFTFQRMLVGLGLKHKIKWTVSGAVRGHTCLEASGAIAGLSERSCALALCWGNITFQVGQLVLPGAGIRRNVINLSEQATAFKHE